MKKSLLAAAATIALAAAAPAFAGNGYLDAGYSSIDAGGSADAYNVGGAYNTAMGGGAWSFQVDGQYTDLPGGSVSSGSVHLSKGTDKGRWGGYVGLSTVSGASADAWEVGVEGALNNDASTISGKIAYGNLDLGGPDSDFWSVGGRAAFYANENFAFGVGGNYVDFDLGGDATSLGVDAEWKPESMPVSFLVGYQNQDVIGTSIDIFSIGVRWTSGGSSLKARDQSGAFQSLSSRIIF